MHRSISFLAASLLACLFCLGCRMWQVGPAARITPLKDVSLDRATLVSLTAKLASDAWQPNLSWKHHNRFESTALQKGAFHWRFDSEPMEKIITELDAAVNDSASKTKDKVDPKDSKKPDDADDESSPETEQPTKEESSTNKNESDKENSDSAQKTDDSSTKQSHELNTENSKNRNWDGVWPLSIGEMLDSLEPEYGQQSRDSTSDGNSPGNKYLEALIKRDDMAGWNAAILWARREPQHALASLPILEKLVTTPPKFSLSKMQALAESGLEENEEDDDDPKLKKKSSQDKKDVKDAASKKPKQIDLERISPSMQSAAAEAWCLVLSSSSSTPVDELAPVGRLLEHANLKDSIRAELFLGIARWAAPASIPRLENALRISEDNRRAPPEIRQAAIESCLIHALQHNALSNHSESPLPETQLWANSTLENKAPPKPTGDFRTTSSTESEEDFDSSDWPSTILDCRHDPNTKVRRTFGRWLAIVRHPLAFEILQTQVTDVDLRVREAAMVSLGILGGEDAKAVLLNYAENPMERVRGTAIKGLANWGASVLGPHADDRSFYVRKTIAEELRRFPSVESALLLEELLLDRNSQVQKAVVESIKEWPDWLAIPLLLHSMRDSSHATRQLSSLRLRDRTGVDQPFPFDAPPEKRATAVVQLARENNFPLGFFDKIHQANWNVPQRTNELHIAEIQSLLHDLTSHQPHSPKYNKALQRLLKIDSKDVPIIEDYLATTSESETYAIYNEVLPKLSPQYKALQDLKNTDVIVRRRGAAQLANHGRDSSLSAHVVRTLQNRLTDEQDNLVWRYAMLSIFADATDECFQIATLAINHTWSDIREQGCRYIARHGDPQHAHLLMPLFGDSNRTVQLAAIEAAGLCRNPIVLDDVNLPDDTVPLRGLRSYITNSDRNVRFKATISMSQLGDPQAIQELVRLSSDLNSTVRQKVVNAMGQTGQTRFIEHLILLGWTETNDKVRRTILESLDLLTLPEKRPPELVREKRDDAKIEIWNSWWQQRQSTGTSVLSERI